MSTHLTIDEVLHGAAQHEKARAAHAQTLAEQSCHEQAKREVNGNCKTGIEYIRAVLRRAQEIKLERMAR